MKILPFTFLLCLWGLASCGQQSNGEGSTFGQQNRPDQPIANGNETAQKGAKMTIVPIMAENNSIVAAACMLPENWQGGGAIVYDNSMGITPMIRMGAQHPDTKMRLTGETYSWHSYSPQHEMMRQQLGTLPSYVRPFEGIERYTETDLMPLVDASYQPTDMKPMNDFFAKHPPGQTDVALLTAFVDRNDPNKIAFLFTVVTIIEQNGLQSWLPSATFIEGTMEQGNEMYEIAKLLCNTLQYNPIFASAITRINAQLHQGMQQNFQIQQNSIQGLNDAFNTTLHSIQRQSGEVMESTGEQFSDMMLGVETYRIPGTGEEVKMPSENEFYYTNGIGDFVGSNNPLFDPNIGYSSYYNWDKLQKKY